MNPLQERFPKIRQRLYQSLFGIRHRLEGIEDPTGIYPHDKFGKKICFTFDDGPHEEYTLAVADLLSNHGIRGTFFVRGECIEQHPVVIQKLVKQGHIIGNHSFDHPHWLGLTHEQVDRQLADTESIIDRALKDQFPDGYEHRYFRPPYGLPWTRGGKAAERKIVHELLKQRGLALTMWQIDSQDWKCADADKIAHRVTQCLTPGQGGVLLFHDSHAAVTPALTQVIENANAAGYEIVSLDQLRPYRPAHD